MRLVPQPLHGERSDELRRGHDRPLVPADVAVAAGAADPAGRRHALCVSVARRAGRGRPGEAEQRSRLSPGVGTGPPSNTGPPGSATSYAWLYTGLDGLAPYNVFHWSLTHQNSVIDGHLATYRGIFVGDAAAPMRVLQQRSGGRIVHASCNVHARREFIQAESNDPILASQAISFYRQLYDVEERGKTLDRRRSATSCGSATRCRSGTACELVGRRRGEAGAAPQRIGEALGYLRNQWSALTVYLGDGRIPIDNDQSEQTIRPLTVGRDNWQFLGHPQAAAGRLQMYSVVSSAHRHHLMIDDYLEDVLRQTGRRPAEPSRGP